jgi:hypothetical protein
MRPALLEALPIICARASAGAEEEEILSLCFRHDLPYRRLRPRLGPHHRGLVAEAEMTVGAVVVVPGPSADSLASINSKIFGC